MRSLSKISSTWIKKWSLPISILVWRVTDLIIAFFADKFDNYSENFAYKYELYNHNLPIPKFLVDLANYDGAHYLHIAHSGYSTYEQAFFPLYSILIKLLEPLFFGSFFIAGLLISNFFFICGLFILLRLLKVIGFPKKYVTWFFIFLLTFPTSFFFGATYTEGLFFFLTVTAFYGMAKRNWLIVVIAAYFASLTRLMGVFLFVPILVLLFAEFKILFNKIYLKSWPLVRQCMRKLVVIMLALIAPIAGLCSYMFYLLKSTGDPLLFFHAQAGFGVNRSTHLILLPQVYFRYFKIFVTANHNLTFYIAILEFAVFNLFLVVLLYNLWRLLRLKQNKLTSLFLGINLFSLINILLPTFTGTLTSMPRYALLSLAFFLQLAQFKSRVLKISVMLVFFVLHILLLTMFIQGYFIG